MTRTRRCLGHSLVSCDTLCFRCSTNGSCNCSSSGFTFTFSQIRYGALPTRSLSNVFGVVLYRSTSCSDNFENIRDTPTLAFASHPPPPTPPSRPFGEQEPAPPGVSSPAECCLGGGRLAAFSRSAPKRCSSTIMMRLSQATACFVWGDFASFSPS